jgi:hypothetical protein
MEVHRGGKSNPAQLAYAVRQSRAILTYNSRDYVLLDRSYWAQGLEHDGILISNQVP